MDVATLEELARIPVPPSPFGIAVTPNQLQVWLPLDVAHAVGVICAPTASLWKSVPLQDPGLVDILVTHDGARALVLSASGVVYVIDAARLEVETAWGFGAEAAERMRLSPDGLELWVADEATGVVTVLDTSGGKVLSRIDTGEAAADIGFTPDGTKAYVPDLRAGTLAVIDAKERRVLKRLPVGDVPRAVAVAPDGLSAYITLYGSDRIAMVDTASDTVSGYLDGGFSGPNGLAVTPDGRGLLVVNQTGDFLSKVRLEQGDEVGRLTLLGNPRQIVLAEVPAFERIVRG